MAPKKATASKTTSTAKTTKKSLLKAEPAPKRQKTSSSKSILAPPLFDFGSPPPQSQPPSSSSQELPASQHRKAVKLSAATLGQYAGDAKGKGKGKAKADNGEAAEIESSVAQDGRLWVDLYEPQTEEELAVHKRKVSDVRRWLLDAYEGGKLTKYRRLLVLSGPAGSGKTATLRVLARELSLNILEWRNGMSSSTFEGAVNSESEDAIWDGTPYESAMDKFEAFLARAGSYCSVFSSLAPTPTPTPSASSSIPAQRRLILLEDLPNILHPPTRSRFHAALRAHVATPAPASSVPVVIVVSDAGLRGEDPGEGGGVSGYGAGGSRWTREEIVDARSVLPEGLGAGLATTIAFNPVAPTLLTAALKTLLAHARAKAPPALVQALVENAAGDVRSAVMGLEFACARLAGGKVRKKGDAKALTMEAATRQEGALALFHLVGKVLYNKRKNDPPPSSMSAKDAAKEKEMDRLLKKEPPVPEWAADEARRRSRVDLDELYAATPIDASLFGLYIHQNYTQFCDEVEQCDGVMDALSWCDANGGENWYQTNPYTFHLETLATLHSLPSPVPRRSQKFYKPAFFDALRGTREAEGAAERVRLWLDADAGLAGTWARSAVVTELGGVLRALDAAVAGRPPREHRLFSEMVWAGAQGPRGEVAEEDEVGALMGEMEADMDAGNVGGGAVEDRDGGWLEGDDIEEW